MKKKAYTLAETLIALAVVGIVAALIIPAFVQNYQKKILSVKIKKFVSTFNQAYKMAIANYGESIYWEDCTIKQGNSNCTTVDGAKSKKILSSMKVTDVSSQLPESYKQGVKQNLKDTTGGGLNWEKTACWQLADGSFIFNMVDWNVSSGNQSATTFMADVNGLGKPNRLGKDIFRLVQVHTELSHTLNPGFYNNYGKLPRGLYLDGYGYFSKYNFDPEIDCNSPYSSKLFKGVYCVSLLQSNGWEFPDYYPWNSL